MKTIRKLFFVVALIIPHALNAQCDSDTFLDNCAAKLDTYTFIKAFNTSMRKTQTVEYSYVFSKGSTYLIIPCDEGIEGRRMIVNLYDRNHKLIASTYNKRKKTFYPDLAYPCSATGVYYMEVTFDGSKGGCGVCLLGFKKN
ncbi:MAG TPA: hypothetical protein VJ951_12290 [Bacteroidales bacterium]|nr:hypothetical protein [Bacteroidales bacterium]